MIRKWEYLNKESTSITKKSSWRARQLNRHSFKAFKKSIKFRKHIRGITRFKRRRKQLRRRRYNYLSLILPILKQWSSYYLKARQFWRFYYMNGVLPYIISSPDIVFFNTKVTKGLVAEKLNIFSVSNQIISYYLTGTIKSTNYIRTLLKSSNNSHVIAAKLPSALELNPSGASVVKHEKLYYSIMPIAYNTVASQTLRLLIDAYHQTTVSGLVCIRKVLVLLILHKLL